MKEEKEERTKSDYFCNWKNYDDGQMGCPDYITKISCSELEIDEKDIRFSFGKRYFKYCPFCGKPINFI